MKRLQNAIERIISLYVPGVILVFMGFFITLEILGRLAFNHSFSGIVDIVDQGVLLLAFLSLAWVQKERSHITVDLLPLRLETRKAGPVLDCILLFLCMVIALFMFYEGCWYVLQAYSGNEQTLTLFWPKWPFAIAIPAGLLFFFIRLLSQFVESLRRAWNFEKEMKASPEGQEDNR